MTLRLRRASARRFVGSLSSLAALAGVSVGCGEPPPAMEVMEIGYTEEELLGLTPSRRTTLADLTALAVAVDRDEVAVLGGPLLHRRETDHLWERLQVERILADQGVQEEVLRARYSANPEHELTVRHLIVLSARYESDAARSEARGKAERALERIRGGEPFPQVAAEVSEEPGAEGREGLLEPGRRGAWVDEFWSAASALDVGEISPVVETQYGFHVIRLEGREEVPFQEVRGRVATEVAGLIAPLDGDADTAPTPEGLSSLLGPAPLEGPSAVVATFDGGRVTWADLLDYAATLTPGAWTAVRDGTGTARADLLEVVAGRVAVRLRADQAGIQPDPAIRAAHREAWNDRVTQWANVLGFRPGMGPERTREAALAALSATGQMPQITRDEVGRVRGLLERYAGR